MYESFYGLKVKPFSLLPDPAFLYLSKQHQMAITLLEYSLENQAGFCVITGKAGTGKTTLLRRLLNQIGDDISIGLITNTHHSFGELLRWILHAFDLEESSSNRAGQHQIFIDYLIGQYAKNRRTMLIIDEAQNMSAEALEELRMLSNINSEKDLLLQVILVGQSPLRDILQRPELEQFAQRVAVDFHLDSLNVNETRGYIRHRLLIAGGEHELFTDDACKAVFIHSAGIPRLINLLCDLSLVYAYAGQAAVVTGELVEQVVNERQKHGALPVFSDISELRTMPETATTRVIHPASDAKAVAEVTVSAARSGISGRGHVHAVRSTSTDKTRISRKASQVATEVRSAKTKSVPDMVSDGRLNKEAEYVPVTETPVKTKVAAVAPVATAKLAHDGADPEISLNPIVPDATDSSLQAMHSKPNELTLHKAQPMRKTMKPDRAAWSVRSISAMVVFLLICSAVLAWRFLDWPILMAMVTSDRSSPASVTATSHVIDSRPAQPAATSKSPAVISSPSPADKSSIPQTVADSSVPGKDIADNTRLKLIERERNAVQAIAEAAAREREALRSAAQARERALAAEHEAALVTQRANQLAEAAEKALLQAHTAEMAAEAKDNEPVIPVPMVKAEAMPLTKLVERDSSPQAAEDTGATETGANEVTTFAANPCKGPSARFLSTCE